jgi:cupin fold WbuC family metalloprotein
MIEVDRINDEVFIAKNTIVHFGDEEILFLKQQAQMSTRKRARICAHKTNDDVMHEMLIAISAESYIHPHKHLEKSESFHIVEGKADVIIFDENGGISDAFELGIPGSDRQFFYRLSESKFHTIIIRSDYLVVHEVTNGPFSKKDSVLASFAPSENEHIKVKEYMYIVSKQLSQYIRDKKR